MTTRYYTPASWLTVLLAAVPGLLVVLTRSDLAQFGPVVPILLRIGLLSCLVIGIPLSWYRRRYFPEWALLPVGLLLWFVVYLCGYGVDQLLNLLNLLDPKWRGAPFGMGLLQAVIAITLFVMYLRGKRLPVVVWLAAGILLMVNLLAAVAYSMERLPSSNVIGGILIYFTVSGSGPVEGLMLVAAGLLVVRRHGLLSLLLVVGGFGYMCLDSDYISGFRLNEWAGYSAYVLIMTALYLVATPVAMLRAGTRLGRALAVFVPVGIFEVARILVPNIVLPGPHEMPWGDMILSLNVLLSLGLGWVLYSWLEQE